jgi:FkbM family methyltransferase
MKKSCIGLKFPRTKRPVRRSPCNVEPLMLRAWRATSRITRTLADAQDLSSRIATLSCVSKWAQGKIGRFGKTHEVTLRLDGIKLTVDASRAELISYWEIWHECLYDYLPGFCPDRAECVIDVGANIGAFSLHQGLKKMAKRVIAFEPSPTVFRRLAANLELNSLNNVQAINVAVGNRCGELPFLELPRSMNSRISDDGEQGAFSVPCVTLDSALKPLSIRKVSLIKIDSEGYEMEVLEGASETLQQTERLIIELHRESDKNEFEALLFTQGFRFIARKADVLFYSR